jgi:hypothetical protein
MDWQAITGVAEIVGALSIVVSLLYVGRQIQQSNVDGRAESHRAFMTQWNHLFHLPLLDRDAAKVIRKAGKSFLDLDGDEQLMAHGYWTAIVLLGQQAFALRTSGSVETAIETATNRVVVGFLKIRGTAQWWQQTKIYMIPEYVSYLDQLGSGEFSSLSDANPWFVEQGRSVTK